MNLRSTLGFLNGGIVDFTGCTTSTIVVITGATGLFYIKAMADADSLCYIWGQDGCYVNIDVGCTLGTVKLYGDCYQVSAGGGTTINNYTTYAQVGAYIGDGGVLVNSSAKAELDLIYALAAKTLAGRPQMKVTTVDLHNGAGAQDIATCATQEIIIDSLMFSCRLDLSADAGAITGISVQTDETTPSIFISAANGIKANLKIGRAHV